jgi:glycine cleavage system transcriptional repressor
MIILTAVGPDRPGMAHALAQILAEAGCNLEDTTMTRLAGEFAMILIVTPPPNLSLQQLQMQLAPLEQSHGLFINSREIADDASLPEQEENETLPRFMVSAYGAERSGLLAKLTGVFASHNVNISDVQSRVASRGTVYVMLFEIQLPLDLALELLQHELERAAAEIGVTVTLRSLEEDTL